MSKPTAIFSRSPAKNTKSSPATSRSNSAKTARSQQTTKTITGSSPRKCTLQTEIQGSPYGLRNGNINVKSKLQFSCPMSPITNQERRTTKPSPKIEQKVNDNKHDCRKPISMAKPHSTTYATSNNTRQDKPAGVQHGVCESDSTDSDLPVNINVKSMRSCFERKENKIQSKPPPSPSPSRPTKFRLAETNPSTPRNTNQSVKGILSSKSKYDSSPTFLVPPRSSTPTPRPKKLRRSASTGTLTKQEESPRATSLFRSSSQNITPKHRVKFQDEATPECFSPVLLESKADHGSGESIAGEVTNLTVAVRVRPPFPGERSMVAVEDSAVKVKALGSEHCFSYDYCFNSTGESAATQEDVFNTLVEPLVDVAFQGYNVCLFAYGQTGSGKSYSMMGEETTVTNVIPEKAGIIPRFSQQLFKIIEGSEEYSQTKVEISYFEIYNEKIHDLLGPSQNGRSAPLRVREHPELGPYVVDLTVHNVHSFEILQDWLRVGNRQKATAATEMNMNSSRSHTIFTVTLSQSQADDRPSLCSKINLIDLAGSERLAHTCATGDRLKEGVSINRSLLTLGKVISSLAENKKRGFIPYRESVLTWLLRESLGGNSRTAMLATISPSGQFVEETLSTLRYACQARNIINTVRINESPHEKRIRELLEEIQRLKEGIDTKDHAECIKKVKTFQVQLDHTGDDLSKSNILCVEKDMEIGRLKNELSKIKTTNYHASCENETYELKKKLMEGNKWKVKSDEEIRELKLSLSEVKNENLKNVAQINILEERIDSVSKSNNRLREEVFELEQEVDKQNKFNEKLKSEINKLNQDLVDCRDLNRNYEKDILEMKNSMTDIKNNSSHEHCDRQIQMLQSAMLEAERMSLTYKEKCSQLQKESETMSNSNHYGCEKEIETLKDTIIELKKSNDHTRCDKVIEKLKTALTEAEKLVNELENDIEKLKQENSSLKTNTNQLEEEITMLKNNTHEIQNQNNHRECEDRINTLKKALAVAKSMNVHVQCENKITELEIKLQNLQSVTLSDHSKCGEKINSLFFAIEKYADDNAKLVENHEKDMLKFKATIESLEEQISVFKENENQRKRITEKSNIETSCLEDQLRLLKEENSRIKKKKVDEENKISSLEQQVISLTKELLDVKSQLRVSLREKESSESLCAQLQEQLAQQDRKLAQSQCSRQLFDDDKENWETPSKVIRRSIARLSNPSKNSVRCSLVMKAEEIHQALIDAEDICSRLKIPWVFQLEPEVTTHSWFDVNVRVWDQRNMNSVRWPQDVFLGWLREMKEEILSKSRGHKLFQSASWLKNTKDPEPLPQEQENVKKGRPLREEVETLSKQIVALEERCELKDKREVLSAVTALGKAVTQLSSKLGLSTPLQPTRTNIKT